MRRLAYIVSIIVFLSCSKEDGSDLLSKLQWQFAQPEMVYPMDNIQTEDRILLGKYLFYNKSLSVDSSKSCGSCHQAQKAFSDGKQFSPGSFNRLGTRNTPTLTNIGYNPYFTREGGVPSLEMQILVPIQEHAEFDFDILSIGERLEQDTIYQYLSKRAYQNRPNYFIIGNSIAAFERTLISNQSKFDLILKTQAKFSEDEFKGFQLFTSNKTNCINCHGGFNFTNYQFENNGLYEIYRDTGRQRLTKDTKDRAKFKVPTLRNIGLTAPYMHDGSLTTLKDVLRHYNKGGYNHMNKSKLIKPLDLSVKEQDQIIAFLRTLTDQQFITNKKVQQ